MDLSQHRCAISKFTNHQDAQQALTELVYAGFPITRLRVIEDTDNEEKFGEAELDEHIENKARSERANCGTLVGTLLGALGGSLVGLGLLSLPGVGLVVAIGTSATAIFTTLLGAFVGAVGCGVVETLSSDEITEYQTQVDFERNSQYKYLVMVDCTDDEVRRAMLQLPPVDSSKGVAQS